MTKTDARFDEVTAVRYATWSSTRSQLYYRYATYGEPDGPLSMDYYFYVLRSERGICLVDTGFNPVAGARRGRTCLCEPQEALARVGVHPGEVSQLIVTHLHYDHIGNLALFPDVEILVPQRELDFWTGPAGRYHQFAEHVETAEIALVADLRRAGRVQAYQGPCALLPGLEAIAVGGHSPGQHALVVTTGVGSLVLASDAVHLYEEIELDRPFSVIADLEKMYRGYETLRALAARPGATLVPGHDPAVVERFAAVPGLEGLAINMTAPVFGVDPV